MWLPITAVEMQSSQHACAQLVFWQHPENGILDQLARIACTYLLCCQGVNATGIAGETMVKFRALLVSRNDDLVRIDHDDVIGAILVWCKRHVVFAAQDAYDRRCKTSQSRTARIKQMPARRHCGTLPLCCDIFHKNPLCSSMLLSLFLPYPSSATFSFPCHLEKKPDRQIKLLP